MKGTFSNSKDSFNSSVSIKPQSSAQSIGSKVDARIAPFGTSPAMDQLCAPVGKKSFAVRKL
jgi:hypothetical protein